AGDQSSVERFKSNLFTYLPAIIDGILENKPVNHISKSLTFPKEPLKEGERRKFRLFRFEIKEDESDIAQLVPDTP
ncbi:unnamed protein product, partial [Didymodactylos carnosus]